VRFQGLAAAIMKIRAFWDMVLCSLLTVHRRFRGAYCSIIRVRTMKMEAVGTSETSAYSNETTQHHIHVYDSVRSEWQWMLKDLVESGRGLILRYYPAFAWRDWEKPQNSIRSQGPGSELRTFRIRSSVWEVKHTHFSSKILSKHITCGM
jgi:hypothetical protein